VSTGVGGEFPFVKAMNSAVLARGGGDTYLRSGGGFYDALVDEIRKDHKWNLSPANVFKAKQEASSMLDSIGIPGAVFTGNKKSKNYVVWNQDVLNKTKPEDYKYDPSVTGESYITDNGLLKKK
jgi:hypothetical protein